ncbi:MAG: M6 family metalloprotease domain-containing protein [Bacteroidales bacterium]|nr:M6 family metalloprotease domain-containing protein [Bacteroidales bacterium]
MKKFILTISAAAAVVCAYAIPAKRGPITVTQPDGSTITILITGDEFSHKVTDLSGNVLTSDENGFYRRAVMRGPAPTAKQMKMRSQVKEMRRVSRANTSQNKGVKHIPVLLVNFANKKFSISNPQTAFTNMLNQDGYRDNGGTGSVQNFYVDNSDGQYTPVFDVYGPYTVSKNYSYYGGSSGTENPEQCLDEACKLADSDVDFSQYDHDGDGIVDMLLFYYAGYNQAEGASNTIWPHQWSQQYSSYADNKYDNTKIGNYFCTSELKGTSGTSMCGIGTTCHEFGHSLGLPDFYDTDYETNGQSNAVLDFSTMDSGAYLNNGCTPPYFGIEERIMLGWISSTAIKEAPRSGSLSIPPVYENIAYKTSTSMTDEYFLYEYRDGTGWDKYLPKGMVVYHVDKSTRQVKIKDEYGYTRTVTAGQLWNDWESYNAINENGSHPCYYVVPAPDPENVKYKQEYWSGYGYYYAGEMSEIPFPGSMKVTTFRPKDWNGVSADFEFRNIAVSGGYATMAIYQYGGSEDPGVSDDPVSTDPDPLPDWGFNYIVPSEAYSVGERLELKVRMAGDAKYKEVVWYMDDKKVSTPVTLSEGRHVIMAEVTLSDDTVELIEMVINVGRTPASQ